MKKKQLTIIMILLTLNACDEAAYDEAVKKDKQSFLQSTVGHFLAFFRSETNEREEPGVESPPDKSTVISKNSLAAQHHLSQVMASSQSAVSQSPDQEADGEDLEQYRKDYELAVEVEDKAEALAAWVQADEKNALPLLTEAYASPEPELRKEAVLQLQQFTSKKKVVDILLKALDDSDPDVVMEAVEGLSGVKSKRVIEGLKKVANSNPDEITREVAQDYVHQAVENAK